MFLRSFRARLSWFFVVIVILPIVMVTTVLLRLVADSETGKADARLAQAQTSAGEAYRSVQAESAAAVRRVAAAPGLARALQQGPDEVQAALRSAVAGSPLTGASIRLPAGQEAVAPPRPEVAVAEVELAGPSGPAGRLRGTVVTPVQLQARLERVTGLGVVFGDARLPQHGDITRDGRDYRVASFAAGGTTISLLADRSESESQAGDDRRTVIALLLAFVLLAFLFAAAVSRSLHGQIERLLLAARRLRRGDLEAEVPTDGNDEFAALGNEFNAMARQLRRRLSELEAERERLQAAIRRVGESIATGSDRSRVLDIVLQTAVDGTGAGAGRASVRQGPGGPLERRAAVGDVAELGAILDRAEDDVLERREPAETVEGDRHAIALPLRQPDGGTKVVGIVSLARAGRPFSAADHDLLEYLAAQAAVSIEHVDAAETVQRQAVTDGLTGLFNHRRFQEVMSIEVERSKRFDQPLGLVMLDLDDFKDVNDQHGHLQGDQVLKEVARVVLDTSREIDEPARYGGEEMAVVLPQTDIEGTLEFAERLRRRIEELAVPVLHGEGVVRITASVGAAALPQSAIADKDALVQAADAALYRAKRLGKNRVVRAG